MKKFNIIVQIISGVKDAVLLPSLIKQNKASIPNEGKLNWIQFAATIITLGSGLWLIYEVVNGRISADDAQELYKMID